VIIRLLALLSTLVVVGCERPPVLTVHAIAVDLTPALRAAIERWRAAAGIDVRIGRGGVGVYRGACASDHDLGCYRVQWSACGDGDGMCAWRSIAVTPRASALVEELVLVHELGHAMGVRHIDHVRAVMGSTLSGDECITPADVRAVCDATGACTRFAPECWR